MRRFEFESAGSSKFWEIHLEGAQFTVRWGKLGSNGQQQVKTFASDALAAREHDKLVAEKLGKGYQLHSFVEPTNTDPQALEVLKKELSTWPKVAHVQLDSAWVKRFDAFLKLGKLALTLLAGLFAAGLVAVTFTTIRLQVMAQAAEIEVARMIGATDAFIRRPFYYFGALQGALGGLLAAGLVVGGLRLLAGPVTELAVLYGGSFVLRVPAALEIGVLTSAGALLGWLGAQLSVSLSLRKFDHA